MDLAAIQTRCHRQSVEAGWWTGYNPGDPTFLAMKIALIHSEISEALEAMRISSVSSHLPECSGLEEELADAVIRVLDLAGMMEFDLESTILEKLRYNKTRLDHQAEARAADSGKKF